MTTENFVFLMFGVGLASGVSLILSKICAYLDDKHNQQIQLKKRIDGIDGDISWIRKERSIDVKNVNDIRIRVKDLEDLLMSLNKNEGCQPIDTLGWGKGKDE
jgi:hypothetical protein